jgi:hypothetical protein
MPYLNIHTVFVTGEDEYSRYKHRRYKGSWTRTHTDADKDTDIDRDPDIDWDTGRHTDTDMENGLCHGQL